MSSRNEPSALQIVLDELRDFRTEMRSEMGATNRRISDLEQWRANSTGKITMLSACISVGVGIVGWIAKHLWP